MSKKMEKKFTKGEWNLDLYKKEPNVKVGIDVHEIYNKSYNICMVYDDLGNKDESIANAKLISAAPDLLEALETLVEKCLHSDGYMQKVDELFKAQQAIKKATE